MRRPVLAMGLAVGAVLASRLAVAEPTAGLRLVTVAADKPQVTLALRTVPGATALALLQDGKELQRYAPPDTNAEGLVTVALTPGTGAIALVARAYGTAGRLLGDSAPLALDPLAFVPEPLALAAADNRVGDQTPAITLSSLTPNLPDTGLPGATVTVALNGHPLHEAFVARYGTLTLPPMPLPLGRSVVTVEQRNAWGSRQTATRTAFNLGEPVTAATYALVDKENYTLYWVRDGALKAIYPIATGRPRTPTPVGTFVMGRKEVMANPNTGWGVLRLLIFSIGANGRRHWGGYAIHGTDQPSSIGKEASHGCVRLFNEDVVRLSQDMPLDTPVIIKTELPTYIEAL